MIHKAYHLNGQADLRRWVMECDICGRQQRMLTVTAPAWLVPIWPDARIYCPDCFNSEANILIGKNLACPRCQYPILRLQPCDENCGHCGYLTCPACGAYRYIGDNDNAYNDTDWEYPTGWGNYP